MGYIIAHTLVFNNSSDYLYKKPIKHFLLKLSRHYFSLFFNTWESAKLYTLHFRLLLTRLKPTNGRREHWFSDQEQLKTSINSIFPIT